jgi:hypothetical protein
MQDPTQDQVLAPHASEDLGRVLWALTGNMDDQALACGAGEVTARSGPSVWAQLAASAMVFGI